MNRLMMQKSSGQQPSQQIQQMLNRSTIQAQEQQVTSLRELLRQEETRLELLKKMRHPVSVGSSGGSILKESSLQRGGGVIRSNETSHHLNNGSQPNISARLQQLVDSVAVDQISSKYSSVNHTSLLKKESKQFKSASPEVITISDTPSPASPPALISSSSVPGVIQGGGSHLSSSSNLKLDESMVMKTVENSRKYRDFVMKQNNAKRSFQKLMDKKIASFPYPKTFRQVWPIIPVQDPSFVKNLGLEVVTQFFEQSAQPKSSSASKVKPICNQCGCDFASAWQIRKNNSKQVLLCESCDFTNLKLLQRTKLATQLKEIVESVKKEEEKFNKESEDARKQLVAVERVAVISSTHKSLNSQSNSLPQSNHVTRHETTSDRIADSVIPSILPTKVSQLQRQEKSPSPYELARKRAAELDHHGTPPPAKTSKTASPHLDHTLNRITQQLLRKQVDEKVHKHRRRNTPSPTPLRSKKTPPPLEEMDVNHTPEVTIKKTPPPLTSVVTSGGSADSRRNRRKGQPRQNRQLSNSDI